MTVSTEAALGSPKDVLNIRWTQLVLGLVCMMAISSPQYVWTLFTKPLSAKLGVPLSELQITFSLLCHEPDFGETVATTPEAMKCSAKPSSGRN